MITSRFFRVLQVFLLFYVAIAVLYTTSLFLVSMCSVLATVLPRPTSSQFLSGWPLFSLFLQSHTTSRQHNRFTGLHMNMTDLFPQYPSGRRMRWHSSKISLDHHLGHSGPVYMDDDIFLCKAFSGSMRPSRILPYFYRASGQFDRGDITIATLITTNRFQVFERLVQRYKGTPL